MSAFSGIRDALEQSAAQYAADQAGITLPAPPVTNRLKPTTQPPSFLAQLAAASKKYSLELKIALGLAIAGYVYYKLRK